MKTVSLFLMKPEFIQRYGGRSFVSLRVELSESSLYQLYELAWTGSTVVLGLETASTTEVLLDGLYHSFSHTFSEQYQGRPASVEDIIVLDGGEDLLSGRRYYIDCERFQPLESSIIRYFRLKTELAHLAEDLSVVAKKATLEHFPFLFDCIGARSTADLFGFDDMTPSTHLLIARLVYQPSLLHLRSMAGIAIELNGVRRFLFDRNENWLRLEFGRLKQPQVYSEAKVLVHDWVLPAALRLDELSYYTLRRSEDTPHLPSAIEPYGEVVWSNFYGTLVSDKQIDLGTQRCLILDDPSRERISTLLGGVYQ
ncbi:MULTISPECIES: hypothetical protein [unclassified Paenibacillus]|uniref:hypothetical protein n=1 Tax=unclassified Paenibacillus TaxID=185978 RepID=UPI00278B472F|nr:MULTISPECIES: hypothetical protein [unclassified Paenibacillus]MDQ0896355.1 hypothetical protein [Paenibacillus sp. V4I7]MDQ0914102.1 hypothetical protein [Paenibacillus sp. V4I5]